LFFKRTKERDGHLLENTNNFDKIVEERKRGEREKKKREKEREKEKTASKQAP
jgi:hypothetical protein